MAQKFIYTTGGRDVTLDDPDDAYTPAQIKDHWASTFPELANATWDTKEVDGVKTVTFSKKVGTKGSESWPAWISVKERLPDEGEPVLLYAKENLTAIGFLCDGEWTVEVADLDTDDYVDFVDNVTHWLPLPPAPEAAQ